MYKWTTDLQKNKGVSEAERLHEPNYVIYNVSAIGSRAKLYTFLKHNSYILLSE